MCCLFLEVVYHRLHLCLCFFVPVVFVFLKNIGGGAFAKCVSLREVIVNAPLPPKIAKSSFKDIVLGACQFYIPRGTKNNYLQDKQWQKIPKLNER